MLLLRLSAVTLVVAVLVLSILPLELFGKRVPPKPVTPVIYNRIEYAARGDGKIGWIAATEIASGKQLWTVRVFRIHTHFWKGEEDNQWIFISDLTLDQGALLITDERHNRYRLDVRTKRVKQIPVSLKNESQQNRKA